MSHADRPDQSDHDRGIRNEERLCTHDVKWVAHAEVHDLEAQALALESTEIKRRLEELNHEAARIAVRNAEFASNDRIDGIIRELTAKIDQTNALLAVTLPREVFDKEAEGLGARVKAVEDWKNKAAGAALILTLVASAAGVLIGKAL